ncbi:MAG TPA: zinc ribbon domain-containing protein, partial [Opitutales bacterium]|nr:zinc ribbon domain-containing protein [Opitutales bacterium]
MPTYDYQCKQCGHVFEAFHSMTAEPLKKCPQCGADALERKIGLGAGIVFKGSGFYGTDYKKTAAPSSTS